MPSLRHLTSCSDLCCQLHSRQQPQTNTHIPIPSTKAQHPHPIHTAHSTPQRPLSHPVPASLALTGRGRNLHSSSSSSALSSSDTSPSSASDARYGGNFLPWNRNKSHCSCALRGGARLRGNRRCGVSEGKPDKRHGAQDRIMGSIQGTRSWNPQGGQGHEIHTGIRIMGSTQDHRNMHEVCAFRMAR